MPAQAEPEIVLYDLACNKNVCFSPVVWRIRLMLNYKRIPYRTIFLEFPDIEPKLKELGIKSDDSTAAGPFKYTVPAIKHVATGAYMMGSAQIAEFLEKSYPDPPLALTSELGQEVESRARALLSKTFINWTIPREVLVLSPRAQEYFKKSREEVLGLSFEDLNDPDKEERAWDAIKDARHDVSELIRTNKDKGPFVLGRQPSYSDFVIVGTMQSARVIDEGLFERYTQYRGFRDLYEACLPYMEKKD